MAIKVNKRDDGAYYFNLHGKKYVRKKKCDAQALLKEILEHEEQELKMRDLRKVTIEQLLVQWLESESPKCKPTTFDRKEQIAKFQIIPIIGKLQVNTLKGDDIQKMLIDLTDKGYSYSTIKKAKEYLRKALRDMNILEKFETDPFKNVVIPNDAMMRRNTNITFYTEKELKEIYKEARRTTIDAKGKTVPLYRLGEAIIVFGQTGMRRGEFLGLKWEDVDFDNEIIHIRRDREKVKNRNKKTSTKSMIDVLQTPKSAKAIRDIPMNAKCKTALKRLAKLTGKFDFVLSTCYGDPINERRLSEMFEKILKGAGMDEVKEGGKTVNKVYGLHAMRHSFATLLINKKGATIADVSRLLGHADLATTMNTYVHPQLDGMRAAVNSL